MHSHYRAACVAWSWDSEFPLFTPATISSTVHCLSPCTGQQKAVYWTCKFKTDKNLTDGQINPNGTDTNSSIGID